MDYDRPCVTRVLSTKQKGSSNHNITLFNHLKRGNDDRDENLLHLFWSFEGVNFSQGFPKGYNEEDQKAVKTLTKTTHHNGERYEVGLPWRHHTAQQLVHGKGSVARPAEAIRERQPTETEIYDHCL